MAVTGATGRLGGRVAQRLAAAGTPMRLLVRDPARAPQLPGASVARASFADVNAVRVALQGASTVLMVSASETPDRVDQHRGFIDAAVAAGVDAPGVRLVLRRRAARDIHPGQGCVAAVAQDDIADAAAAVLSAAAEHAGRRMT